MRFILSLLAVAVLSTAAVAQKPASEPDHAAHHSDGASAPAAAVKKTSGMRKGQAHKPGGMHDQKHGQDGKMMGGAAMPAASAASK